MKQLIFNSRKEALKHLSSNAMDCVAWENSYGSLICAIYWNGKLKTEKVNDNDKKGFKNN